MTIEKRKSKKEKDNMIVKLQPMADHVVVKPIQSGRKNQESVSIFRTLPKKNLRKAKSSPSVPAE